MDYPLSSLIYLYPFSDFFHIRLFFLCFTTLPSDSAASPGRLEGCMRVLRKQLSDDLKQGVTNDQVPMSKKQKLNHGAFPEDMGSV